jgi:hypothetical protein
MATFELDETVVRVALANSRVTGQLAAVLKAQLSLPTPTKLAAVVRCDVQLTAEEDTVFIRYTADPSDLYPWVQAGTTATVYSNAEIGRIIEVLFEGVDV